MIEKLVKPFFVRDELGYTDQGLVSKVNEIIKVVNQLEAKDTADTPTSNDVVERSKINKAIEEIKDASYVLHGVVVDLKDVLEILERNI